MSQKNSYEKKYDECMAEMSYIMHNCDRCNYIVNIKKSNFVETLASENVYRMLLEEYSQYLENTNLNYTIIEKNADYIEVKCPPTTVIKLGCFDIDDIICPFCLDYL